jgi:hypothetical protein
MGFTGILGSGDSSLGDFELAFVPSTVALSAVLAPSENVVRLVFTSPPFFSGLLEPTDASSAAHYSVAAVAGTFGLDGTPARAVTVVSVAQNLAVDPTGATLDLTLDRPMTPAYAQYVVSATGLADSSGNPMAPDPQSSGFVSNYRQIVPPSREATPSRDIANPQDGTAQQAPRPISLGTFNVDDTGDYALDQGLTSLKKRILRRLVTAVGGFAHLPGYGVGIPAMGKKLARAAVLSKKAADAQAQILLEPEVATCSVTTKIDPEFPGLVFFLVNVQTKTGQPFRVAVPFPVS